MKKTFASIAVLSCVLCLAGCSNAEHKITDPIPDKVIVEEEPIEEVIEDISKEKPEEIAITAESIKIGEIDKLHKGDTLQLDVTILPEDTTNKEVIWTTSDESVITVDETGMIEIVNYGTATITASIDEVSDSIEISIAEPDPYSGLAVSKCHSVVLPKGVDYNTAIAEITKGTSAYPNTFPVIDNVDFNTPGVYTCAWVRLMDDGTYLPLNYAVFTVTIVEEYTGAALIDAEYCKWSMSNHSAEIIDYAKQYVHYYGNGEISGALVKEITVPGEYTIRWTSTDGAKFDQTVLVTE